LSSDECDACDRELTEKNEVETGDPGLQRERISKHRPKLTERGNLDYRDIEEKNRPRHHTLHEFKERQGIEEATKEGRNGRLFAPLPDEGKGEAQYAVASQEAWGKAMEMRTRKCEKNERYEKRVSRMQAEKAVRGKELEEERQAFEVYETKMRSHKSRKKLVPAMRHDKDLRKKRELKKKFAEAGIDRLEVEEDPEGGKEESEQLKTEPTRYMTRLTHSIPRDIKLSEPKIESSVGMSPEHATHAARYFRRGDLHNPGPLESNLLDAYTYTSAPNRNDYISHYY